MSAMDGAMSRKIADVLAMLAMLATSQRHQPSQRILKILLSRVSQGLKQAMSSGQGLLFQCADCGGNCGNKVAITMRSDDCDGGCDGRASRHCVAVIQIGGGSQ